MEDIGAEFGKVKSVKFFENKANGKSKGYAFVEFHDPAAARACKEKINGRFVTVTYPPPPPPLPRNHCTHPSLAITFPSPFLSCSCVPDIDRQTTMFDDALFLILFFSFFLFPSSYSILSFFLE